MGFETVTFCTQGIEPTTEPPCLIKCKYEYTDSTQSVENEMASDRTDAETRRNKFDDTYTHNCLSDKAKV